MGSAMCVQKKQVKKQSEEVKKTSSRIMKEIGSGNKQKASQSVYAKMVEQYFKYYGRKADDETRDFIEKNYHPQYYSTVQRIGFTPSVTYKDQVIDRIEAALNNGYKTFHVEFTDIDEEKKTIYYDWIVHIPNKNKELVKSANFRCKATFDELNRFKTIVFNEYVPYDQALWSRESAEKKRNKTFVVEEWNDFEQQKKIRGW